MEEGEATDPMQQPRHLTDTDYTNTEYKEVVEVVSEVVEVVEVTDLKAENGEDKPEVVNNNNNNNNNINDINNINTNNGLVSSPPRYGGAAVAEKRTPKKTTKKPEPLLSVNVNVAPKGFFDVPVFTGDERIVVFERCFTDDLMKSSGVLVRMLQEQADQQAGFLHTQP